MKRSGSPGGRGFVGWVAMVLAVALLVGPALREPTQFVMAQTNPAPAVKPPLDISGLAIIQALPIGGSALYEGREAQRIINSWINLILMQMDLENFSITINNPATGKDEVIIGGELGRILRKEVLAFNRRLDGLGVTHKELVQTPGLTPTFDEDKYDFDITGISGFGELSLYRDFGRADKGFPEWGVGSIVLKILLEDGTRSPKTEELAIIIDRDEVTREFLLYYTKTILAPDGTELSIEQWKFEQGNPKPVSHRPMGPP